MLSRIPMPCGSLTHSVAGYHALPAPPCIVVMGHLLAPSLFCEKAVRKATAYPAYPHRLFRLVGPRAGRGDCGKVHFYVRRVLHLILVPSEKSLQLVVSAHQFDIPPFPPCAPQVPQGLAVDREDRDCRPVFWAHIGYGGPILELEVT